MNHNCDLELNDHKKVCRFFNTLFELLELLELLERSKKCIQNLKQKKTQIVI